MDASPPPVSVAPLSFQGMDWLYVLNLTMASLCLLVCSFIASQIWSARRHDMALDPKGTAAEIVRRSVVLILTGVTLRALSDDLSLYGWNSALASSGGWATAGRFLDPAGFVLILVGATTFFLTETGINAQLRTPPLFHPIWKSRETVTRFGWFAVVAFLFALLPVVFH